MKKIQSFLLVAALLISVFSFAQSDTSCVPKRPHPSRLVNDLANVLSQSEEQNLENKLEAFSQKTSNQICIVTVNKICGDKALFTYQIGHDWGIGNKKFNNGVVILVKPKTSKSLGQAFIAVGYGLEGALPDATAKLIAGKTMIPHFKDGDYVAGLNDAVNIIMKIASGQYSYQQYTKKAKGHHLPIFPIFIIIFIILFGMLSNVSRAKKYAVGHDMSFWAALMMMSTMSNIGGGIFGSGGGFNDFSSGGGNFGGGFGGFGGGDFGGGGAGGSW